MREKAEGEGRVATNVVDSVGIVEGGVVLVMDDLELLVEFGALRADDVGRLASRSQS